MVLTPLPVLPPLPGAQEEVRADDHDDHRHDRPEEQQDVLRPHVSTRSRKATARSKLSIRLGSFSTVCPSSSKISSSHSTPFDWRTAAMCSDSLTGTRGSLRPCWMKSGARMSSTRLSGDARSRNSRSCSSEPYSRSRAARRYG